MQVNLPYQARAALYVLTALGTPVVGYLAATHVLGQTEVALWSAEVSVVALLAAFNTTRPANE